MAIVPQNEGKQRASGQIAICPYGMDVDCMKVIEVYEYALSMLPSSRADDDSLRQYALMWVNSALVEMFEAESSIRASRGEEELIDIPWLENEDEEIPYSDSLVRGALVWYLASLMAKDDDTDAWAVEYRNRYIVAVDESKKNIPTQIKDYYAASYE